MNPTSHLWGYMMKLDEENLRQTLHVAMLANHFLSLQDLPFFHSCENREVEVCVST